LASLGGSGPVHRVLSDTTQGTDALIMGAIISAPLSMLATCAGSLFGSCCASLACKACTCACVVSRKAASISYLVLVSVAVVAALLFDRCGGDIVIGGTVNATEESWLQQAKHAAMGTVSDGGASLWNGRFWCAAAHPHGWVVCCEDVCGGIFSVYRFSFTLACFFGALALLTAFASRFAARVHRGFWIGKMILLAGLLVSTLFISNEFFVGYREAARYLSFVFLLLQILLLIDFAYTWNETWIGYGEASDNEGICGWKLAIVVASFVMYAGSIGSWVLMFFYFGSSECAVQQTIISLTLIACAILTVISCSRFAPHGTLLTSAAVTSYASFLCYSALASHPDRSCNPVADRSADSSLVVGLLVAMVSMASSASNATSSKEALVGKDSATAEMTKPLDGDSQSAEDDEVGPESWWYFHLMMVASAFYMAMLLTDWSTQPDKINGVPLGVSDEGYFSVSLGSFWVKLVSQWVALAMYAWTLLAPYLLRDTRDFGVDFDF